LERQNPFFNAIPKIFKTFFFFTFFRICLKISFWLELSYQYIISSIDWFLVFKDFFVILSSPSNVPNVPFVSQKLFLKKQIEDNFFSLCSILQQEYFFQEKFFLPSKSIFVVKKLWSIFVIFIKFLPVSK